MRAYPIVPCGSVVLLGSALALAGGCSSSETGAGGSGSSSSSTGSGSQDLAPPPEADGFQLAFDRTVSAGTEVHVCREFVVPGEGPVSLSRFETQVPQGMHHVLAYHTPKKASDVTSDVFDCGDVPGPIFYEQSADGAGEQLPEGVGVVITGGEVVRLELHYLNVGQTDLEPTVKLNAWYAKEPLTAEAGSFFMYDRDIAIPAHGSFTARMHCEIPSDITIVDILPHVHVHGVAQRMVVSGGDLSEPKAFVTTTGYNDQETRRFPDGLQIKAGQSLDFECDYDNATDEDVVEGPSKEHNEMCMLLGDYYPRLDQAAEWCTQVGSGPLHDGTHTCKEAYTALQDGNNLDFAAEQTMVEVCKGSNDAWNNLGNCGFNACSDVCPGPDCSACAAQFCIDEYVACQAATCD